MTEETRLDESKAEELSEEDLEEAAGGYGRQPSRRVPRHPPTPQAPE